MTVFIHPYQLDDTQYPIGFINSLDASKIDIVYLKRNEFPQEVVGSYANYLLNKNLIKNFKCFYSDVDCWLQSFNTHTNPNSQ